MGRFVFKNNLTSRSNKQNAIERIYSQLELRVVKRPTSVFHSKMYGKNCYEQLERQTDDVNAAFFAPIEVSRLFSLCQTEVRLHSYINDG